MGTSTVDYALCNQYIYKNVENFIILPLNELSDHSKIVTYLKSNTIKKFKDEYKWKKIKTKFKWDNHKRLFSNNIMADKGLIDEISQRIEAGLIESTGEMMQKLYFNAALKTLKQKNVKIPNNLKKSKKQYKKWFDNECIDLLEC